MRWPRLTTRRIMAMVLGLAVGLGLGIPAVEVWEDRSPHVHGWVGGPDDLFGMAWDEMAPLPFRLRYWERFRRGAWDGSPRCGMGQLRRGETCYLGALGTMADPDEWHDRVRPTPVMLEAWKAVDDPPGLGRTVSLSSAKELR